LGEIVSKKFAATRLENRDATTLAVTLSSLRQSPVVETTFTENLSSRGARVVSTQGWCPGERLSFALLPGDFCVTARVVYCYPRRDREFALGLEFLEPVARWFPRAPHGSGNNLHG
jgi:hypothetical protein